MIAQIFSTLKFVSDKIKSDINKSCIEDERFRQLIDLYNQQNDYEEGSAKYIFDIKNPNDVDYLFDDYKGGDNGCHYKEPRVAELSLMVVNRNSDYFLLCEEDATFITEWEIANMIEENAYKMAQFLFRHPEDHKELWEDYVTRYLDKH